jgi:hypothetical protein
MGTYVNVEGNPNEIGGKGAVLRGLAEGFQAQVQGVVGEIEAVEGEHPQASDKYGQAFDASYKQVPEGGTEPLRDSVVDGMSRAGERLVTLGGGVVDAMASYQGTDAQNASDITHVADA